MKNMFSIIAYLCLALRGVTALEKGSNLAKGQLRRHHALTTINVNLK